MGLFSRMVAKILPGQQLTGQQLAVDVLSSRGDPPRRGTQEFLDVYDTHPWVRGAMGKVAQEVGATKWYAVNQRTDKPVPNHVMVAALRAPNPLMSGAALLRVTQLCLDLTGVAFWFLERNGFGAPAQYWPIPPHWVVATPTPATPTFELQWMGLHALIPLDRMCWLNDPSPVNPYARGSGIIRALADEIETDEYSAKHAKALFFNRAMPEVVITDKGASREELLVHERHWRERLQGLFRSMGAYFTNRELGVTQLNQMNLDNLTLVPLRKWERDITLQAIGMPPEQMGLVENSNRATIEASDFVFHSRLIKPRREFLADELTLRLASQYDPNLALRFVDTTPRDRDFLLNAAKAAPWTLMVDEHRELQGRGPLPNGEGQVKVIPLNMYPTTDLRDPSQRPVSSAFGAGGAGKSTDT